MSSVDYSRPSPQDGYYDVFLSFRGIDTRRGFTTNLYHALQQNAIHTFMDEELMGEEIDYLFRVMEKSRMGVIIYSENFASSDWCLKELDTILQRQKEKKIAVTPIFYKVDLKELKHITGKTAEHLDEHIAECGEITVELWKVAVKKLGGVSGISYKEIEWRSEYRFIEHVIAKIKKKLTEVRSSSPEPLMKPSDIEKQRPNSSNQAAKNTSRVLNQVDKEESDEKSPPTSSRNETTPISENLQRTLFYEAKVPDHMRNSPVFSYTRLPLSLDTVWTDKSSKAATPNRSASRLTKIYVSSSFRSDPIPVQVDDFTTIRSIKTYVGNILGLNTTVAKQHLYYNGEELQNNNAVLISYNMPNEATLYTFKQ